MADIKTIYGHNLVDTTARTQIQQLQTSFNNLDVGTDTAEVVSLIQTEINKLTLGVNPTNGLIYIYYDSAPLGNGISVGDPGDPTLGVVTSGKIISLNSLLPAGTYTLQYENSSDNVLSNYDEICEITKS